MHIIELKFRPNFEVYTTGTPEARHYVGTEDGHTLIEQTVDGTYKRETEYDRDRLVLSETNGAGQSYRLEYDHRGNRTTVTDPAGNQSASEYDEADCLLRRKAADGHATAIATIRKARWSARVSRRVCSMI